MAREAYCGGAAPLPFNCQVKSLPLRPNARLNRYIQPDVLKIPLSYLSLFENRVS